MNAEVAWSSYVYAFRVPPVRTLIGASSIKLLRNISDRCFPSLRILDFRTFYTFYFYLKEARFCWTMFWHGFLWSNSKVHYFCCCRLWHSPRLVALRALLCKHNLGNEMGPPPPGSCSPGTPFLYFIKFQQPSWNFPTCLCSTHRIYYKYQRSVFVTESPVVVFQRALRCLIIIWSPGLHFFNAD